MASPEVPGIATGLVLLAAAVERLSAAARTLPDLDVLTTGEWSARMVLVHVTFLARELCSERRGPCGRKEPNPLRGTHAALAEQAHAELGHLDLDTLLTQLATAHAMVSRDIGAPWIELIPYRQGRLHTPPEHLHITVGHIDHHASELEQGGR